MIQSVESENGEIILSKEEQIAKDSLQVLKDAINTVLTKTPQKEKTAVMDVFDLPMIRAINSFNQNIGDDQLTYELSPRAPYKSDQLRGGQDPGFQLVVTDNGYNDRDERLVIEVWGGRPLKDTMSDAAMQQSGQGNFRRGRDYFDRRASISDMPIHLRIRNDVEYLESASNKPSENIFDVEIVVTNPRYNDNGNPESGASLSLSRFRSNIPGFNEGSRRLNQELIGISSISDEKPSSLTQQTESMRFRKDRLEPIYDMLEKSFQSQVPKKK